MGWGGGSQGIREEKSKSAPKPGKERAHGTEFQREMLWETPSALPTGMLCVSTETQQRENHWEGLRSYSRTRIPGVRISSRGWRSPEISWESTAPGVAPPPQHSQERARLSQSTQTDPGMKMFIQPVQTAPGVNRFIPSPLKHSQE